LNKKTICIIIFTLLITITFPFIDTAETINTNYNREINIYEDNYSEIDSINKNTNYDTLDQQQISDSGWSWAVIGSTAKMAQSFIPTLSSLTKVELKIKKQGNPTGLTISIRSSLTGGDLTTKYESGSSISTTANWHEFNIPDISVTPGATYYIIWDPNGEDSSNNIYWRMGDSNPYSNGNAWIFLGSSWAVHDPAEVTEPDFCFKTYGGVVSNNPPNTPSQPSGPITGSIDVQYSYYTVATDPENDWISYRFDFGNTLTGWTAFTGSGVGNSEDNIWPIDGTYQVKAQAKDLNDALSGWSTPLIVTISSSANNPPNKPDTPSGATSGKTGTTYSYSTSTTDPEGDQVYYLFDWGDGSNSGWDGPHNSGDIISLSHSWSADGTYPLKVKAKDTNDEESTWSDPLSIAMPKPKLFDQIPRILVWLFEHFPFLQPYLNFF